MACIHFRREQAERKEGQLDLRFDGEVWLGFVD
jgi:hypothetical protein